MIQSGLIESAHNDLVTDASYDFYGLRLATCSLDQRIKIWRLDETTGTWDADDDWKAHDAAVSKVHWAHPEFGSIVASSSFDRTVKVWEETSVEADPQPNGSGPSSATSRWVERATLVDAKGTVRAVEFAPRHFGLKLASIASDNYLRIYECLEQPSLTTWQLSEEIDVHAIPSSTPPPTSLSHTLAQSTPTQTHSSLEGPNASLVATALQQSQPPSRPGMGNREADGGWCISWCKDKYWGELIAAGAGVSGVVKIIQISPTRRPVALLALDPYASERSGASSEAEGPTAYAVTSVSWAPSCGRSYHLIATGSRDGRVRIWKVKPPAQTIDISMGTDDDEERWSAHIVADFDDHKLAVGRVEWNITGTVLSSAGNDGRVRLWKATVGNVWRAAGHLSVEQAEESRADVEMDNAVAD
ncbi:WD40 repeat-like protein [Gloeophyllum trabeum ATCC 11539]|uniref:WD40 repeat-like protein n=1 Tax=Gloeophyllum trabeum (strain ATCC 11539 / FP-39264 / Madison 617) TaxID=670483 RepID=S7RHE0_GLOTA|nr:WD40 repeat-like protein [Gloeophyllum trabeum ATCC 11539]EPQ53705.1 WD40 repeat-like protein [Gloeophyllum trabeum ATCC 11539]